MADSANELTQIDAAIASDNEAIKAIDEDNARLDVRAKTLRDQANEFDAQIAANQIRRAELRRHRESLSNLRNSSERSQRIATDEEIAAKNRADAEKLKADHAALVESTKAKDAELAAVLESAKAKEAELSKMLEAAKAGSQ